ncbi:hypothetical protein FQR65_LT15731 [Abscondita terminalis]|nr:hypothetical protein FQR65_LT15731 [Abscondita terminalis]
MSSWDVIIWKLENLLDVVPSSWAISEEKTFVYPKNVRSSKIEKLKRLCVAPTAKYQYVELEAIHKKTICSYNDKEKYLTVLECNSNIESDINDTALTTITMMDNNGSKYGHIEENYPLITFPKMK